jgi:hypothetical protein
VLTASCVEQYSPKAVADDASSDGLGTGEGPNDLA